MSSTVPRRTALRGAAAAVLTGAAGTEVGGCSFTPTPRASSTATATPTPPEPHEVVVRDDATAALLDPADDPSIGATAGLLTRATAAVVVAADAVAAGTPVATALGVPLLVWGPATPAELDRLGTRTVVRVPAPPHATPTATGSPAATGSPTTTGSATATSSPVPDHLPGREIVDAVGGTPPLVPGLPLTPPTGRVMALVRAGEDVPPEVEGTLHAAGATRLECDADDVRLAVTARAKLRAAPDATVLGVTAGLGPRVHFAQRVRTVRVAAELPGGGFLPFPERRMVALYGHPQTSALGMLGEQSARDSVARVRSLVADYASASTDRFVPAFEIIATIASGSAGADGRYSTRTSIGVLEPWVDTAQDAGVYVVLDLQPGRTDFLTQARSYERLLTRPHVGLALDPEWRLGPGQVHLRQIGSVGIDEVNEVGAWLAALVRDHDLPPKVLTLHEFSLGMIRDRERLDTSLDEVQWLLHADGQGSQPAKQATWAALRRTLPAGVWLGWKNFEDEDHPMLTPAQTLAQVHPTPSFVSYQ